MRPGITTFALSLLFSLSTTAVTLGPEVEMAERIADAGDGTTTHRAVAGWNGRFYVVWSAPRALMLGIFDGDGAQVDERALVSNVTPGEAILANDGTRLLVVWSDAFSTRIAVLSEDGSLAPAGGLALGGRGSGLDIAAFPGSSLVIWRDGSMLRGSILDQNLQKTASIFDGNFPATGIRAASDGEGFLLTWTGTGQSPGLFTRVVRPDGSLGEKVVVDTAPQQAAPSIAWNGGRYLIASAAEDGLRMSEVLRDGTPDGTPRLTWAHEHVTNSALSTHPFGFMVVAEHWVPMSGLNVPQPTRLYSFLVSRSGSPFSAPVAVSTVDALSTLPAIDSNGIDYFATWNYSAHGDDRSARGTIIHLNGEVLFTDPPVPGLTIAHGPPAQSNAHIAHGRNLFLAVWADTVRERNEFAVRFARLDENGRSLDGAGIDLARTPDNPLPSFACGTVQCLAAWQVSTGDPQTFSLMGRWISLDGRTLSPPFTITPQFTFDYNGSLATDGETFATVAQHVLHVIRPDQNVVTTPVPATTSGSSKRYLVASNSRRYGVFWSDDAVRCAMFDRNGILTATTTLLTRPLATMAVTGSDSSFLLVTDRLEGLRIAENGVPLGASFDIAGTRGHEPTTTWSGTNWIVTWSQHDIYGVPTEMFLTTVESSGTTSDHTLVADRGGRASLGGSRSGSAMIVFPVTLDMEPFGKVTRFFARAVDAELERKPRRHPVRR